MNKEIKIINFVFKYNGKINLLSIEEYLNYEEEGKIKLLIDDKYIEKYEIQTVGAYYHQELWIPAEELEIFNSHIVGKITVIKSFT